MYSGMPSGETILAPRSRITSCWVSSVDWPPIPVAMMQPMRIGSYGASSSQPASASASPAATSANWAKRSGRRASLTDRSSLASNSRQAPAPSAMPTSPAAQRSCRLARADPERRDRAEPGDDDLRLSGIEPTQPARATIRSMASPTVLSSFMSSPLSTTPYSSSTIWASSTRSSESMSSSSKVAVAGDLALVGAEAGQRLDDAALDLFRCH